jgi:hypothetical protein
MRTPPFPPDASTAEDFLSVWRENRSELISFIQKLPEDQFAKAPASGGWSASEIAEHLYLTQWNLARSLPIVLGGKFGKDKAELKSDLRYETLSKLLIRPRGAKNPIEVGPKGGMDKAATLESLQKSMDKLDKAVSSKTKDQLQSRGMDHPFFGAISMFDWLWVMTNHEATHIQTLINKYS